MHKLLISALALLLIVFSGDVQAQNGSFFEQPDGSYGYIVHENDDFGQWQIAMGNTQLWLLLVKANPQLENPDIIRPGDMLNVPSSLYRTFQLFTADQMSGATVSPPRLDPPTVSFASASDAAKIEHQIPLWVWLLLAALVMAGFVAWRRMHQEILSERKSREQVQESYNEAYSKFYEMHLRNPYSGPAQVEGGLPTVEAAAAHATKSYRESRGSMTVQASSQLPDNVTITRIRAIDLIGPMYVRFGDGREQHKVLDRWTPAWQVFFSDGTESISLLACGNDVRFTGKRIEVEFDQQIRDRQEDKFSNSDAAMIRERQEVPVPQELQQVWGNQTETPDEPEVVVEDPDLSVHEYREVRITSPTRCILLPVDPEKPERIIDTDALGGLLRLGISGGDITAETDSGSRLIGRVTGHTIKNEKTEPSAAPADESADTRS